MGLPGICMYLYGVSLTHTLVIFTAKVKVESTMTFKIVENDFDHAGELTGHPSEHSL